jgi:flagellar hook-length control protein FliK
MAGVASSHLPTTSLAPSTGTADAQAAGKAAPAPLSHVVDVRSTAAVPSAPAQPVAAQPPAAPTPAQAAGMVFGFALSGGVLPSRRADATEPSPREIALQALSAAAGSGQVAGTVVATGHAPQTALDMRRDDWPQTMIDHIEALRDAADATSTRITLMPDALGKVDVSIRHDGDAVHVHFAADVPQTRTMLADAQPRLAEAAQVRGVKLGQATVDAGGGEAGRQQPQQQQSSANPPLPPRPASAMAIEDDAAAPVSTRLA